jgi:hypothetical protein
LSEYQLAREPQRQHEPSRRREGAGRNGKKKYRNRILVLQYGPGTHHARDRTRGADQRLVQVGVAHGEHDRGQGSRDQVEGGEHGAAPHVLDERPREKQEEQVSEQVQESPVQELVGDGACGWGSAGTSPKR